MTLHVKKPQETKKLNAGGQNRIYIQINGPRPGRPYNCQGDLQGKILHKVIQTWVHDMRKVYEMRHNIVQGYGLS